MVGILIKLNKEDTEVAQQTRRAVDMTWMEMLMYGVRAMQKTITPKTQETPKDNRIETISKLVVMHEDRIKKCETEIAKINTRKMVVQIVNDNSPLDVSMTKPKPSIQTKIRAKPNFTKSRIYSTKEYDLHGRGKNTKRLISAMKARPGYVWDYKELQRTSQIEKEHSFSGILCALIHTSKYKGEFKNVGFAKYVYEPIVQQQKIDTIPQPHQIIDSNKEYNEQHYERCDAIRKSKIAGQVF